MRNALYLQEREGGDRIVLGIASLLHDVHRAMENETGAFVTPKDSLDRVRGMLVGLDLTPRQVERICFCIEHHEDYNWNGDNVDDLDALIVQDADNLDAVGAIGIARGFCFAGAHGVALYNPDAPIDERDDYVESGEAEASAVHHFFHKSLKLGANMNTPTARELANRRIDFMRTYIDEFLAEWNAEC